MNSLNWVVAGSTEFSRASLASRLRALVVGVGGWCCVSVRKR